MRVSGEQYYLRQVYIKQQICLVDKMKFQFKLF